MDHYGLLKKLTDDELFNVMNGLGHEIGARICDLLESHNITCFTFPSKESSPEFTAFDYDKGDVDIIAMSIGYTIDKIGKRQGISQNLFIVDENDTIWWGDDAIMSDGLWDVYSEMKKYLK